MPVEILNKTSVMVDFASFLRDGKELRWMEKPSAFSAHCPTRESCTKLRKGRNDQENETKGVA